MGLLDDAIRQHLDLKRQHGADESELRRKEDEALGPARREAPAADQVQPAAEPDELEPVAEEELAQAEEMAAEDLVADEEAHPAGLDPTPAEPGLLEDDSPFEEPFAPAHQEESAAPSPPLDEPGPLDEGQPAAPEGEEDVLEETPEFLQETPEHDRLWFEQKPPRDFDFDDE